jgi:hypothetical protein
MQVILNVDNNTPLSDVFVLLSKRHGSVNFQNLNHIIIILPAKFDSCTDEVWGTRWHSWLRHCATSRKVAGSIPDGVTGIFH